MPLIICFEEKQIMIKKYFTVFGLLMILSHTAYSADNFNLNITLTAPLGTPEKDGFLNQVVKEMLNHVGYEPNYEYVHEARGLQNLNDGIDDGNLPRVAGLEKSFPNIQMVPGKVMDFDFQVFSKQPNLIINGWNSFDSLNVAFVKGWKILEKNVSAKSVTTVPTSQHLFQLLENNRVDAIIYERWQGIGIAKSLGFREIKPVEPPLITKEMFLYVNKKHNHLIQPLANALKQMKNNGQYQKIKSNTLSKAAK